MADIPGRRGLMLILSSPSGAGKTTLSRRLLKDDPEVMLSISVTTRPARPGEANGKDYVFVSDNEFQAMAERDELLEWATVFGHRYGTPKKPVEVALEKGTDVLFDIDWQGTQQLAQAAPNDIVRVFIIPPSIAELKRRLEERAQDSEAVVSKRMAEAESELSHWAEYDYVIINDNLDGALEQIRAILKVERLKRVHRPELTKFVQKLMADAQSLKS